MNLGLIGSPVEKSISPELQRILFKELELDNCTYEKHHVASDDLPSFFDRFKNGKFDGINITIPHKETGLKFLDEIDDNVKLLGNTNCIKRVGDILIGYNTDLYGFKMLLEKNNINVHSSRCLVLGAGGSARTIIKALIDQGAESITIKNKSIDNALAIQLYAQKLGAKNIEIYTESDDKFDIAINTTPLGMYQEQDDTSFFDIPIDKDSILIDLIYISNHTLFLNQYKDRVKQSINGLEMLIFQAIKSIEIWTETTYDVDQKLDSIKKQLEKVIC
ncbi:MAG: shikimate dehydrogenase [Candidatus Marinimicrobia bacterium]|nr:shikimate dehydrogenase [Gammaproteobacteria bacterium]MBL6911980.1 shikimate dehydrogenase [Candidatus Neomarinimicrobiota bacterium]MBT3943872.1 shikimate dehydrogenase [Candidatus Neomarinimicrobiota bacterium]MBT3998623.1 shikimate dehydrogenase [Candidatus Neomarinimicrobiota bacterium]MBT4706616.1 shikimate dehydrogenase [Candidatus Neomarinimicrobiota bacterium]